MKVKYYTAAIASLLSLAFCFMPLVFPATVYDMVVVLYFVSKFWFMIAWVVALLHVILCIVSIINKNPNWIHHLTAAFIMLICYAGYFINGHIYGTLSV